LKNILVESMSSHKNCRVTLSHWLVSSSQCRVNMKFNVFPMPLFCYEMAPNKLKMMPNVVSVVLIPVYPDMNFWGNRFPFYFSPSISVICTSLVQPCSKKYTSLSFASPINENDQRRSRTCTWIWI